MAGYTYIWEFYVAPSAQSQFELTYGPRGPWVMLFRDAPGYIETLLLHDQSDPLRYVTVDRWVSADAHDAFRSHFSRQYDELDRQCRGFTTRESLIGEFGEQT
jgi:heme-degrading monooxygenase HmoA